MRRRRWFRAVVTVALAASLSACGGPDASPAAPDATQASQADASAVPSASETAVAAQSLAASAVPPAPSQPRPASPQEPPALPPGTFTVAFAGDVNFAERTADRLAADPSTAFGVAAEELSQADLTVVNLETAITTSEDAVEKSYVFKAPATAFDALRAAGIDVVSMANNHGADYGSVGLQDSLDAIAQTGFPVIGIGADDTAAHAPFRTALNGAEVAIFAASQIPDETLANFTADDDSPGIASAYADRLVEDAGRAVAAGQVVIVFLHWGTEYDECPNDEQRDLAAQLAAVGVSAVIGTHAHVLQGAGWRPDGTYVAYGLSNYLWWRSFDNEQDDNGVLTLTFDRTAVTSAAFAPAHLDDTGVPVPATGADAARIMDQWERVRECAELAPSPPA